MDNWLLDSLFETSVNLIAEGREVSPEKARRWIDDGLYTAARAKETGIIDTVQFRQDFVNDLKAKYGKDVEFDRKYGKKKRDEVDLSSPFGLLKLWAEILQGPSKKKSAKTAVAIIYVDGAILPGKPAPSPFGSSGIAYSEPIRKALDKAAADDSIKAVVLRVDSPGGSATASEIILDATRRVKAKKPLVVSMGNVAGSGGYYVGCASDTIFAGTATITASIGVVSGKFATTGMWNKIGITWHTNDRGANSGLFSSRNVFSEAERRQMRALMDEIYGDFKGHVVAIRGDRLKKDIDELAGGRVFTGKQALELGLVDKIGGLDDAIAHVAEEAKIDDYEIRVLPKPKTFLDMLLADLGGGDDDEETGTLSLSSAWGPRTASLFRAAMPYLEGLDPERVRAIEAAFQRLSLIEKEGVILAMPPIEIRD
jgi:protease-4